MRSLAVVSLIAVLSGCAQVFESNLFESVDTPPPLSSSAMSKASVDDIQKQIADPNTATAFYEQLKDNHKALDALQDNLIDKMNAATSDAKVDAAQALVLVTAYGTDTSTTVNEAIKQATNLQSGGTPADAIKALMADKSTDEIIAELTQFQTMQTAFKAMQGVAEDSTTHTIRANIFYGAASSATKGDLAQIALVAAAADALILDAAAATPSKNLSQLAAILAAGGSPPTGANMNLVSAALDGSKVTTTTNADYAYLSAVTGIVPF